MVTNFCGQFCLQFLNKDSTDTWQLFLEWCNLRSSYEKFFGRSLGRSFKKCPSFRPFFFRSLFLRFNISAESVPIVYFISRPLPPTPSVVSQIFPPSSSPFMFHCLHLCSLSTFKNLAPSSHFRFSSYLKSLSLHSGVQTILCLRFLCGGYFSALIESLKTNKKRIATRDVMFLFSFRFLRLYLF